MFHSKLFSICVLMLALGAIAPDHVRATTAATKSSTAEKSIRALFIEFLEQVEQKIGRTEMEKLPKDVLFQQFLEWHKQRTRIGK